MIDQISHSVPLSAKRFTEDDLNISMKYISDEVYPGLYNKSSKDFIYVNRRIMKISEIKMEPPDDFVKDYSEVVYSLLSGNDDDAERVCDSIKKFGYQLFRLPIVVALTPNGLVTIVDGRTRLNLLKKEGFVNVIVDYYICTSWNAYELTTIKSFIDFYY
jgi:hypothetical protein